MFLVAWLFLFSFLTFVASFCQLGGRYVPSAASVARLLFAIVLACTFARAECPVHRVIVAGQVSQASTDAEVRVELLYANHNVKDSAEATVENGAFKIQVEFLTLSKRSVLVGDLGQKCGRKPSAVVVKLMDQGKENQTISLDFPRDFQTYDSVSYSPRSPLVLKGGK